MRPTPAPTSKKRRPLTCTGGTAPPIGQRRLEFTVVNVKKLILGADDFAGSSRLRLPAAGQIRACNLMMTGVAIGEADHVNDVPGGPELVGERDDAGSQSLRVVEEQHLGHGGRV